MGKVLIFFILFSIGSAHTIAQVPLKVKQYAYDKFKSSLIAPSMFKLCNSFGERLSVNQLRGIYYKTDAYEYHQIDSMYYVHFCDPTVLPETYNNNPYTWASNGGAYLQPIIDSIKVTYRQMYMSLDDGYKVIIEGDAMNRMGGYEHTIEFIKVPIHNPKISEINRTEKMLYPNDVPWVVSQNNRLILLWSKHEAEEKEIRDRMKEKEEQQLLEKKHKLWVHENKHLIGITSFGGYVLTDDGRIIESCLYCQKERASMGDSKYKKLCKNRWKKNKRQRKSAIMMDEMYMKANE